MDETTNSEAKVTQPTELGQAGDGSKTDLTDDVEAAHTQAWTRLMPFPIAESMVLLLSMLFYKAFTTGHDDPRGEINCIQAPCPDGYTPPLMSPVVAMIVVIVLGLICSVMLGIATAEDRLKTSQAVFVLALTLVPATLLVMAGWSLPLLLVLLAGYYAAVITRQWLVLRDVREEEAELKIGDSLEPVPPKSESQPA